MIIKLVGNWIDITTLEESVRKSLTELNLIDEVSVEITDDAAYKMELWITENPALCIEESSIDFKDVIFQWEIPEYAEIKSMFLSILWDDESHSGGSCSSDGWGCSTWGCEGCSSH